MDHLHNCCRMLAAPVFMASYIALLLTSFFPMRVIPLNAVLVALASVAAFLGSPLFGRIDMVACAFFLTIGISSVTDAPLVQIALLVLEGTLLAIYLLLVRPHKCKNERLVGGCAIAIADALFLIDIIWGAAL